MGSQVDGKYYEVAHPGSLSARLMAVARRRMHRDFLAIAAPRDDETILDIGVSDVITRGANMLETSDRFPERITAVGLGPGEAFRVAFPAVAYTQIVVGAPLPFPNRHFAIATSNAVLEPAGSVAAQRQMIAEMVRVARRVFLTVPNRYFPVEHHTGLPFMHWTDRSFRLACHLAGRAKWAEQAELILMSESNLRDLVPRDLPIQVGRTGLPLGPFSSNLYLAIGTPQAEPDRR